MTRPDPRPDGPRSAGALVAVLALVAAPHAARLPIWVLPALAALGFWRFRLATAGRAPPGRLLLLSLTAAAVATVVASVRHPIDRDAFLTLLVVLSGLKLLEMRTRRDRLVLVFLACFLVLAGFLYRQSIPSTLYLAGVLVFLTAAWLDLAREGPARPFGTNFRLAVRLLGQALPMALIVFALFPRVTGRLWGLPQDPHWGVSGLSDRMFPGSVSRVVLSDAVAFRAEFEGPIPAPVELYWRGPVFDTTDGVEWRGFPERKGPAETNGSPAAGGVENGWAYAVTLEPHGKHWLFGLDVPVTAPEGSVLTPESVIWSRATVRERMRYAARSRPRPQAAPLTPEARARALHVPFASERVRSLARRLGAGTRGAEEIVARALDHFRAEEFVYTLTPPRLGSDPVDEFLFGTRQGFCEHFAAAFAILMRLAGAPARVVTGYQGGEYNPLGGYVLVLQAHAHAWAEVWLPGAGWVRVDPTAAVAPDRVELPIDNTIRAAGASVRFVFPASGAWARGLQGLRFLWDAVNNGWNQWVIGYGPKRQLELLSRLGLAGISWGGMIAVLAVGSSLALIGAAVQTARGPRRRDPLRRAYGEFCRKLAGRGLRRLPHEGPLAHAERVCAARRDIEPEVRGITDLYLRLRYAPPAGDPREDLRLLRSRVRRLRL